MWDQLDLWSFALNWETLKGKLSLVSQYYECFHLERAMNTNPLKSSHPSKKPVLLTPGPPMTLLSFKWPQGELWTMPLQWTMLLNNANEHQWSMPITNQNEQCQSTIKMNNANQQPKGTSTMSMNNANQQCQWTMPINNANQQSQWTVTSQTMKSSYDDWRKVQCQSMKQPAAWLAEAAGRPYSKLCSWRSWRADVVVDLQMASGGIVNNASQWTRTVPLNNANEHQWTMPMPINNQKEQCQSTIKMNNANQQTTWTMPTNNCQSTMPMNANQQCQWTMLINYPNEQCQSNNANEKCQCTCHVSHVFHTHADHAIICHSMTSVNEWKTCNSLN